MDRCGEAIRACQAGSVTARQAGLAVMLAAEEISRGLGSGALVVGMGSAGVLRNLSALELTAAESTSFRGRGLAECGAV